MARNDWYPTPDDMRDPARASRMLREVYSKLYAAERSIANLSTQLGNVNADGNAPGTTIINQTTQQVVAPSGGSGGSGSGGSGGLTLAEIRDALEHGGSAELDLTGLTGVSGDVQRAGVRYGDTLPPVSQGIDGELFVLDNGTTYALYQFFTGAPGEWRALTSPGANAVLFTHAQRTGGTFPAADYMTGTLGYETDREVFYMVQVVASVNTWVYVAGTMRETLANKPADLGTNDTDFLFYGTDYHHLWQWNGSGWQWGPGEEGSEYIRLCMTAPTPSGGWQVMDGSTVAVSKSDASTANVTVPNFNVPTFLAGDGTGSGSLTPIAALAPTATVSGSTAAEAAHTHPVDPASTASGAPSATVAVQSGAGTTVATDTHTHATDIASFNSGAGSSHSHAFGTLAVTVGTNGNPRTLVLNAYYRR